ncbi:MAG: hypothetical protein HUU49_04670 [Candidatus Buchananbacteria bacterium]|nr:hypothetical protein [Candidatus Buchananbacteria bacterium]
MKPIRLKTKHLHLDSGEIIPAVVVCTPNQPLEILAYESACDLDMGEYHHIALARCDPHVHARQNIVPSREEFEALKIHEGEFDDVIPKIHAANLHYDVYRASLAALKGGVWLIGCMGNTPWGPIGVQRWQQTLDLYRRHALVYTHVWPRLEPGVPAIDGQEGKDFGSTFGGAGLSADERDAMFALWAGQDVSFHNDMPRPDQTIDEFFRHATAALEAKFHLYYNGETVLQSQRETIALARKHHLRSLRTRHVPTGPALEMLLAERKVGGLKLPIEVGLDYLYWSWPMVVGHRTGKINYRRPAFPSEQDQLRLIAVLREVAFDPEIHLGSDHAPHSPEAKQYKNGLPGSPGTRLLEHSHQIHAHLVHEHNFTWHQIDHLAAIHPTKYLERYYVGHFAYPIATMASGAMCNLVVFDPDCGYCADERILRTQLHDPDYHNALWLEPLRGKVLFTVVNGRVYDVSDEIKALN